jgi:hypothetical protein
MTQRVGEARDAHVEPRGEHDLAAGCGVKALPRAVEDGGVALELTERDAQGAGVERVLLGPAQQAGPEGNLPARHGAVLGHLGDGDAPDRVTEFGVPLEVGERLVHVARWFIRHVQPEQDGAHSRLLRKGQAK